MSNSSPPGQRPPRFRDDEPIALLVVFLAFGAIFFWALTQGRQGFDVSSWLNQPGETAARRFPFLQLSPSPTPTVTLSPPTVQASPTVSPTVQVSPTVAASPTASPTPTISPEVSVVTPTPTLTPTPVPTQTVVPVPPPQAAIAFPDVPNTYWAYPFIAALSARGIIGGFPDGNFKPNEPVTRGQFAIQLQKAFTKPDQRPPKQFPDVPANYGSAVDKAVKSNFMTGYPDGTFRPEQQVSRVEAVSSMVKGLGTQVPANPEAVLQAYPDNTEVPAWARGSMAAAIQAGLLPGDPNSQLLKPNQAATRADVAALVYKGMEATGQIPRSPQ